MVSTSKSIELIKSLLNMIKPVCVISATSSLNTPNMSSNASTVYYHCGLQSTTGGTVVWLQTQGVFIVRIRWLTLPAYIRYGKQELHRRSG